MAGRFESVIAFGVQARKQLETITNAAENIARIGNAKKRACLQTLSKQAQTLSTKRKAAADKLAKGIETELDDLKMASARFGVDFQTRPDPNGIPLSDGNLVGVRRHRLRPGGVPGRAQPGRGIEAACQDRLGRRDLPPHAGVEERAGPRRPDPHPDLRRDRPGHRRARGRCRSARSCGTWAAPTR